MLLASSTAPVSEYPFRDALIHLLLSDKYQMHVNASWAEETEDIAMKRLRHNFSWDYLHGINWEETKYGKLYLDDLENVHNMDPEAYLEAIELPLHLGIVMMEDLCFYDED